MKKQRLVLFSIALLLTLTIGTMISYVPSTKALSTAVVPTYLYLTAEPNPVGAGQTVTVNFFMSKPTTTAYGPLGDHYEGVKVVEIPPSGSNVTYGPYELDATGGWYFTFTPTMIGNYTFQAYYPGQVLSLGGQTGLSQYNGLRYESSASSPGTLTVQQTPITGYSSPPLPTAYWTRPINAMNYGWASQIGGNWWGGAASAFATTGIYDAFGDLQNYSTAPTTGHIMWTRPTGFGGQPGGPVSDETSQYASSSIEQTYFEPIIINGVLYYCQYPGGGYNAPQSWQAIDLHTGQPLASFNTTAGITGTERLVYGEVFGYHTVQEYGSIPLIWSEQNYAGGTAGTAPPGGTVTFNLYDPMTGYYYCSIVHGYQISVFPDYNASDEQPGTLIGYYTTSNSTGTYLNEWNSTRALAYPWGFTGQPFINPESATGSTATTERTIRLGWQGYKIINWTVGIQWTKKITTGLSIAATCDDGVVLLRSAPSIASYYSSGYQTVEGIDGYSGAVLWGPVNQTVPIYDYISLLRADDGIYAIIDKDTNQVWAWSDQTGQQLWGPVKLPGNAWSTIADAAQIAYGRIYIYDYGGYCSALDLQTGKIDWTWTPPSEGYNVPYGVYPFWIYQEVVANGMIFLAQGKEYDPPLSPGAQLIAINCTTGKTVWSILNYDARINAAVADGYLVSWNAYDKQIYCFGQGPTKTTAQVQNDVLTLGGSIMIKGMVTDLSPGTQQAAVALNYPQGLPAVSDASMSEYMQAIYMQQPMPTNTTGVPVTLYVLDSNNNYRPIGTTTTNANGFYSFNWKPDIAGNYTVTATFAGTPSYYSSSAQTAFIVSAPSSTLAPAATPLAGLASNNTLMYGIVAIIIVIIIIGAVLAILVTRKRP